MDASLTLLQTLDASIPGGCYGAPYLVIFLEYVVHLSDVFAGHGFDDEAVVVGGQEAVAETTLRVAVERSAPCQRVLCSQRDNLSQQDKNGMRDVHLFCSNSLSRQ